MSQSKQAYRIIGTVLEFLIFPLKLIWVPIDFLTRPLDRRMARNNQRAFEEKIRRDAPVLFDKYHAEVVPNEGVPFPPPFDGAFVTLRADGLLFRFETGRGDFQVRVTSVGRPRAWIDLDLVVSAVEYPDDLRRRGLIDPFAVGQAVDRSWDLIKGEVLSDSETKGVAVAKIKEREEIDRRVLEQEINRNLYGR